MRKRFEVWLADRRWRPEAAEARMPMAEITRRNSPFEHRAEKEKK